MNEPLDPNNTGASRMDDDELTVASSTPTGPPPPPSPDEFGVDTPRPADTGAERLVEPPPERAPVEEPTLVQPTVVERQKVEDPPIEKTPDPQVPQPRVVEQPTAVQPTVVQPAVVQPTMVEPTVVERQLDRNDRDDRDDRTSILRVPTFSPVAPIVGLLAAWGAIVVAVGILQRANIGLGFNIGIAEGGPGDDGFWAGVWLLVVNAGGFLIGGYAAARIARANGVRHAVLVWVVAMMATGADALIEVIDSGTTGVVRLIPGVPFWADTNLTSRGEAIAVLAIFAGAALAGAFVGGVFGQTANRIDRTDDAVVRT